MTSTNEVTPMVIAEALAWGIPILSTDVGGIKEMFRDKVEGFIFSPGETEEAVIAMNRVFNEKDLHQKMSAAAFKRHQEMFKIDLMGKKYRNLIYQLVPPVILIDMDGVLVDWDGGFNMIWGNRTPIHRKKSYYIENCMGVEYKQEAEMIFNSQGFFEVNTIKSNHILII